MGNVRNVKLHVNASTLRGLTYFILFNVVSENHSVHNPPGEWGLYPAQGLLSKVHLTFLSFSFAAQIPVSSYSIGDTA